MYKHADIRYFVLDPLPSCNVHSHLYCKPCTFRRPSPWKDVKYDFV